jgi:hypothetical protein
MPNIVVSNFINERWVDRLYQNFNKSVYLLKPDGKVDLCKVKKVKSKYYLTSTGKWFNSAGLRIDEPAGLDKRAELSKFKSEIEQAETDAKFQKLKQTIRGN